MTFTQQFMFSAAIVAVAPDSAGIYLLYQHGELIYIGRATGGLTTIRSRLMDHMRGDCGPCTTIATHYAYEIRPDPIAAEVAYLAEFKRVNGVLPRCNDRIG